MMKLTIQRLRQFFQHKNHHGGLVKQASELPTALNFLKNGKNWQIDYSFTGRVVRGHWQWIAMNMAVNDYCVCENRGHAITLHTCLKAHKKAPKTKSFGDKIYVWRVA